MGICAGNSAEHIVALLAVLACGKVWVPLNPKSTHPEIRRILEVTEPSILVLDPACAPCWRGARRARPLRHRARGRPECRRLCAAHAGALRPLFDLPPEATQAIKFTGGTTGLPKGVMQPYRAWMANIANQIRARFDADDRYVVAAPVTHGTSTYLLPIPPRAAATWYWPAPAPRPCARPSARAAARSASCRPR